MYWPDPADDWALSYDWEEERDLNSMRGRVSPGVTWRMTTDPFRIVPTWVRNGAETAYEQERILWALAGEPICSVWGIPASLCDAIDQLVLSMARLADDLLGFYGDGRCNHVDC